MTPKKIKFNAQQIIYRRKEDILHSPKHFKLVFNFTDYPLSAHFFKKRSAFNVFTKKKALEINALKEAILPDAS